MPYSRSPDIIRYFLRAGYIFISLKPALISTVLGNCVAVSLFDRRHRRGGMNHFLFPEATHPDKRTPKYGTVAVPALIQLLKNHGSVVEDLEAQVFGGATLSYDDTENQGWQNVRVALNALAEEGIRVCSQDVGGTKGRRVVYHTATNEAIVMKTDKIRQEDWMSYLGHVVD